MAEPCRLRTTEYCETFSRQFYFNPRGFSQKSTERKSPKKYLFSYFGLMPARALCLIRQHTAYYTTATLRSKHYNKMQVSSNSQLYGWVINFFVFSIEKCFTKAYTSTQMFYLTVLWKPTSGQSLTKSLFWKVQKPINLVNILKWFFKCEFFWI